MMKNEPLSSQEIVDRLRAIPTTPWKKLHQSVRPARTTPCNRVTFQKDSMTNKQICAEWLLDVIRAWTEGLVEIVNIEDIPQFYD